QIAVLFFFQQKAAYDLETCLEFRRVVFRTQQPPARTLPEAHMVALAGGHQADWLAAGTYDKAVGISLFTLQFTHKIEENTDVEQIGRASCREKGVIGGVEGWRERENKRLLK